MSTRFLPKLYSISVCVLCCAVLAAQAGIVFAQTHTSHNNVASSESGVAPATRTVGNPRGTDHSASISPAPANDTTSKTFDSQRSIAVPTSIETPAATPDATFATPKDLPLRGVALSVVAQRLKLPLPLPNARIVVLKSQRRLELWNGNQLVKAYYVALGGNPVGAKSRQHDNRTPEGHFRICTRNAATSAFHIFLGLSYPDVPDAARGLNSGAISWREYALIQRRLASRGAPLWETRLGGWVGIHGGTGSPFAQKQAAKRGRNDWTAGCVALTDREIEELYVATKMGTPVWIRP